MFVFFFKQKTAYEMRISDWSSDVCSSDLNEFGPENIDNDLLIQDSEEQIIELSNGCVCCTIRGDLVRALRDMAEKREAGQLRFDRVIIETTGMANPGPVCQTFFMDDDIADTYRLEAVITIVDAKPGRSAEQPYQLQSHIRT